MHVLFPAAGIEAALVRAQGLAAAVGEVILLEIQIFIGLAAHALAHMAGGAAVGLEALVAFRFGGGQGALVAAQPAVETAVGRDEGLFVFGDGVRDVPAGPAVRIDGAELGGQCGIGGRAAVPELHEVEHGIEGGGRVHIAQLLADAFGEAAVVRAGLVHGMAGGAGHGAVGGQAGIVEQGLAQGHLGLVHGQAAGDGLDGLVGMFGGGIRGVVGFAALGHPGQDVLLVLVGKAAAPVHHGELGGRHGVIEDDPFHLGQHGLAHGAVLALHQLLVEVQGTDAVPVILFDDAADAGDLGVERQVIAAGMAGHALVLHDARDTGELVLHIVQPLRRGGGTGQQHEGCGSQQFFLHIVLLGGDAGTASRVLPG